MVEVTRFRENGRMTGEATVSRVTQAAGRAASLRSIEGRIRAHQDQPQCLSPGTRREKWNVQHSSLPLNERLLAPAA